MIDKDKQKIIDDILAAFNFKSIDEASDDAVLAIMSLIQPPVYGGASTIYEESNKAERKTLIADLKKCLANEAEITYQLVQNEGVRDSSTEEYFKFCSRHSVWYEITLVDNV